MNENYVILDEICSTVQRINSTVTKRRQETPGTMNIAEIMNRHHLENQHSNILGFLLDSSEKHHHPEYGEEFLKIVKGKELQVKGSSIISIKREESTDEARRMDLFIETENDLIILENKINAEDQFRQISDYISFVENNYSNNKNILVIYLTPFGKDPSEKSIPIHELNELIKQKRYIKFSYQEDILRWLLKLQTRESEPELKSGLIQYIDVIKGITNQRKEVFNMNQETVLEYFNKYGKLSREELRKKTLAAQEFMDNINFTLFINLFIDIYKGGNGKVKLLFNGQSDYKDINQWVNEVLKTQKNFGVRYENDSVYRDLYVQDLITNKFIYASTEKENLSWCGKKTIKVAGFKSSVYVDSWFLEAIRDEGKHKYWEDGGNNLSFHIIHNWWKIN